MTSTSTRCLFGALLALGSWSGQVRAQEPDPGSWLKRQRTLHYPQAVEPGSGQVSLEETARERLRRRLRAGSAPLDEQISRLEAALERLSKHELERFRGARQALVAPAAVRRYLGPGFQLVLTREGSQVRVLLENRANHAALDLLERDPEEAKIDVPVAERHLSFQAQLHHDRAEVAVEFLPPFAHPWGRESLRTLADLLGVEPSPAQLEDEGAYRRAIAPAVEALEAQPGAEVERESFRYGKGYRLRLTLPFVDPARELPPEAVKAYLEAERAYMDAVAGLAAHAFTLAMERERQQPGASPFALRTSFGPVAGWSARVLADRSCGGNVFVFEPEGAPRVIVHQTGAVLSADEQASSSEDRAARERLQARVAQPDESLPHPEPEHRCGLTAVVGGCSECGD